MFRRVWCSFLWICKEAKKKNRERVTTPCILSPLENEQGKVRRVPPASWRSRSEHEFLLLSLLPLPPREDDGQCSSSSIISRVSSTRLNAVILRRGQVVYKGAGSRKKEKKKYVYILELSRAKARFSRLP